MSSLSSWLCECRWLDDDKLQSKKIDQQLKKEKRKFRREVTLLLLGSGESGKSTFLKQMVIIHGRGEFTVEEAMEYKEIIYSNVLNGMRALIAARLMYKDLSWQYPERSPLLLKKFIELCPKDLPAQRSLCPAAFADCASIVAKIWEDASMKETFERRSEFQLPDSCSYFFDNIQRIRQFDYFPTNRDILFSRKATRAITELVFNIQNVPFRFIDIGGQRSQRQKWFEYFDGVTSIVFLIACNEFDQLILEDRRTNRLMESRAVFETIVNNRCFAGISFILFLNKTDLLIEKVKRSDIKKYFPAFHGDSKRLEDVQYFLLELVDSVRSQRSQPFFYHFTTAVDTDNIRRVFNDCRQIILERNLKTLMMQ